jgi:hypothetical protein
MALRLGSAHIGMIPANMRGETFEQQRAQDQRMAALAAPYDQAVRQAQGDAMQQANAAAQRSGNVFLGRRTASTMAQRATAPILAQRAAAQSAQVQREIDYERARREAERNRAQQLLGGLISAGGQVLGTVMPAFAPAAGAASAVGGMIGGNPQAAAGLGGLGGMLMGQPQAPRSLHDPIASNGIAPTARETMGYVDSIPWMRPPGSFAGARHQSNEALLGTQSEAPPSAAAASDAPPPRMPGETEEQYMRRIGML